MKIKLECINAQPLGNNENGPALKDGEVYTLHGICKDSKGNQHYDVGLESNLNYVSSFETGEELPDGDKIHWCHPSRFIVLGELDNVIGKGDN